jgi:dTDP-4-dehydrorhamnose reductase
MLLLDLPQWDVTSEETISFLVRWAPDLVIHAAAMTDVDGCERDPEAAFKVNGQGTRNAALACQRCNAIMVYISTDYVFDGTKDEPYLESDEPHPINFYGASKLEGERHVQELLKGYYIVRTAWLYGPGGRNFVEKVLQLAEERPELHYVITEIGSPTYTRDLAEGIACLVRCPQYGIYHLTNEGSCSRYEFAREILDLGGKGDFPLYPAESYPRPAKPPPHAILANVRAAKLGIRLRPWQEALVAYFQERSDG